jgi:hypothetical protein
MDFSFLLVSFNSCNFDLSLSWISERVFSVVAAEVPVGFNKNTEEKISKKITWKGDRNFIDLECLLSVFSWTANNLIPDSPNGNKTAR